MVQIVEIKILVKCRDIEVNFELMKYDLWSSKLLTAGYYKHSPLTLGNRR